MVCPVLVFPPAIHENFFFGARPAGNSYGNCRTVGRPQRGPVIQTIRARSGQRLVDRDRTAIEKAVLCVDLARMPYTAVCTVFHAVVVREKQGLEVKRVRSGAKDGGQKGESRGHRWTPLPAGVRGNRWTKQGGECDGMSGGTSRGR